MKKLVKMLRAVKHFLAFDNFYFTRKNVENLSFIKIEFFE